MQNQEKKVVLTESKSIKRRAAAAAIRCSHVEAWKQSGLSMSEYCRQQNIAISSFSAWAQTVRKSQHGFKPIAVKGAAKIVLPEKQPSVIEIIANAHIKIRLINVLDSTLIANIAKDLIKCS